MRVETERLYLYPISNDEMSCLIDKEDDIEMKQAYTEMLEGCLLEPDCRIWYAVWNMELKNAPGTIIGDFSFKGLGKDGVVEIGYGLKKQYRHHGYMTETIKAITEWALSQEGVCTVEAETDPENVASQNVLKRAGYVKNGIIGKEGPRFVYKVNEEKIVHHIEVAELSNKYHVRKLYKTDLESIYRLSVSNKIYYQYHPPFVTRKSILEDMDALPLGKNKCDKYYVGFFDNESLIAIMDLILDYPEVGCGFIGLFMMDMDYQNKGIGTCIIKDVLGYLKLSKFEKVRLGVDKGNPQSYSFWSKNKFIEINENNYIVMERML